MPMSAPHSSLSRGIAQRLRCDELKQLGVFCSTSCGGLMDGGSELYCGGEVDAAK